MFNQADAYERYMGRWSRLLAPAMVDFSEIRDGDVVLDVGSGTGALSLAVLDVNRKGRIAGIDLSSDYVAFASKQRTEKRIHFEVGDAQQLRFPDAEFDKTLSLLGVNFIPDPARAVKEMARVTRPGGLVAAAVWDYAEGMQMLRVFWDEAVALEPKLEPKDEGHMPLCRSGELTALWKQQGLENVRETPLNIVLQFASFADYWAPFLLGQGPAGACVAALPRGRQQALEQRLRERLLGDGPDRPIELNARAWAVKGAVPKS